MKILIYIHRTNIVDFNDEKTYDQIKKLFEENASEFQYKGNVFLTVNSAGLLRALLLLLLFECISAVVLTSVEFW